MNKQLEKVLEIMERALKNDTAIEWHSPNLEDLKLQKSFDGNRNFLTVNIYHLNDVYSTQYTLYKNIVSRSESYSITKFRDKLGKDVLKAVSEYLYTPRASWSKIQEIFDFYEDKFQALYEIKYKGHDYYDLVTKLEKR